MQRGGEAGQWGGEEVRRWGGGGRLTAVRSCSEEGCRGRAEGVLRGEEARRWGGGSSGRWVGGAVGSCGAAYRGAADGEARRILALGDRDAQDLLTNLEPCHLGGHPLLVLGGARVEDLDEQLDLAWARLRGGEGEIESGGWGEIKGWVGDQGKSGGGARWCKQG